MRKFSMLLLATFALTIVLVMGNTYRAVLAQAQGQKSGAGVAAIP